MPSNTHSTTKNPTSISSSSPSLSICPSHHSLPTPSVSSNPTASFVPHSLLPPTDDDLALPLVTNAPPSYEIASQYPQWTKAMDAEFVAF